MTLSMCMQVGCGAAVTHIACTHCLAPSVLRMESVCSNVPYYTYKVSVKRPPQAAHTHFRYAHRHVLYMLDKEPTS